MPILWNALVMGLELLDFGLNALYFIVFLLAVPSNYQGWILLVVFWGAVHKICTSAFVPRRHRKARPRWKRERKYRRRRLAYWLVRRCRRRRGNRPPKLDGSTFVSPATAKHRRWRRRKARAKARLWRRRVVEHEFFCNRTHHGRPLQKLWLKRGDILLEGTIHEFCCETNADFPRVSRLLAEYETKDSLRKFVEEEDHVENIRAIVSRASSLSRGATPTVHIDDTRCEQLRERPWWKRWWRPQRRQWLGMRASLLGLVGGFHKVQPNRASVKNTVLIWDTGASFGLTPFRSDFVDYVECDIKVKDVTKVNTVIGIGTTISKFKDAKGADIFLPCVSYHLTTTDVRLFSPQTYHQMHGGTSEVRANEVIMHLDDHDVVIPIDRDGVNLPIVKDSWVSSQEKARYGPQLRSAMGRAGANELDIFGDLQSIDKGKYIPSTQNDSDMIEEEFEHYSHFCGPCVGHADNDNLSGPQKELLLWHWKLGISMFRIQELMRPQKVEEPSGAESQMPPVIKPKFASTPNCVVPACTSCALSRSRKRSPGVVKQKVVDEKAGALSADKYVCGDCVSADQYVVRTPGRLESGYGREPSHLSYHGGTIYTDAASGVIYVQNQVSLGAGETVLGKIKFEEWLWEQACVEVKHYHSDNGIFTADMFRGDCNKKGQTQSFSGVGAQHQNARAERAIQSIMYMARTFMVHAALHWTSDNAEALSQWSFAVKHAAWLYNRVPRRDAGIAPLEFLTQTKHCTHRDLLRAHVWGCPVFVLDPKLQNDQKIPKWNRRARMGQFLGFSESHSSQVALVRHLITGHVSPQYHVVFDDLFQTVFASHREVSAFNQICDELFDDCREVYAEEEYEDGELVYRPPPLDDVWLDEPARRDRREALKEQRGRQERREQRQRAKLPDIIPLNRKADPPPEGVPISDDDSSSIGDDSESEGEIRGYESDDIDFGAQDVHTPEGGDGDDASEGAPPPTPAPRKTRGKARQYSPAKWRRGPDGKMRRVDALGLENAEKARVAALCPATYPLTRGPKDEPVQAKRKRRRKRRWKYKKRKRELREEGDNALNAMALSPDEYPDVQKILQSPLARFITFAANDCGYNGTAEDLIVNHIHPMFLKAKASASKEDNPNWWEAMNSTFADEYWKAACKEIETLEKMGAWEVVDIAEGMNVIDSTWAFKLKRYPDGLIKKFKARFCARGDQQLEGVDFFETYAPVVQWTTVRLMLILEVLLDLKSKQGDVTAAFLHADVPEGENIYVAMPKGFKQAGKCLRLKKTLYGLRQSPRAFWKYLVEKMEAAGLKQSDLDPCLFIGEKVICCAFVDDLLFWARDEKDIVATALKLRELGVDLEQEEDAAGFLGVTLERDAETGQLEMKQTGLIDRVIEALGLDDGMAKGKETPAAATPLVKDVEGPEASGAFSYSSVVGMLLYLSGHTRPDIAYAVNCCARYMFCPRRSHEVALKRIGRYLKHTRDRGIVLNPSKDVCKVDCYPDADFAGLYGHEKPYDPSCVKSRTGYVITFADCPVHWQSKLQTQTAQSTMEAEIIALAHSCRELFPIMDMSCALGAAVGLPVGETTMNVSIHEDNAGALILADLLPPEFTPRSKYYAISTVWFREEIKRRGIKLLKIDTKDQLGDIFTKGLTGVTFEYLRKKLLGW
jgi:hypothetical protein